MQITMTEYPLGVEIDGKALTDLKMFSYDSGPSLEYAPFEHFVVITYTGLLGTTRVRVQVEQHHEKSIHCSLES